ncbi:hypothetical protein P7K49_037452 [Saguinus oedipus]|uniref:Uncharacterized protein n=1 Tax=Saguinus oedipus TaxID=9490 RepID=A0ABQ9TI54_SAGOE|nr:hypothetical protein P7K49_037452 [Saguinus oedipus]
MSHSEEGMAIHCRDVREEPETGVSATSPKRQQQESMETMEKCMEDRTLATERMRGERREIKEACGASIAENPSFNNFAVSLTSINSFTDDLGYEGSQELTIDGSVKNMLHSLLLDSPKEEDSSLVQMKRRKRNKVSVLQMRRNDMKEEDEEDEEEEEDKAEGPLTSLQSPRTRGMQCSYPRTLQVRHKEHLSVLESSLSSSTNESKLSGWSLSTFCQYLCSCCHRKQKSVEENKASDSGARRSQVRLTQL